MLGSRIKKTRLSPLAEDFKALGLVLAEENKDEPEAGAAPADAAPMDAPPMPPKPAAAPVAPPVPPMTPKPAAVESKKGVIPPQFAKHVKPAAHAEPDGDEAKPGDKHGDKNKGVLLELPTAMKKFQKKPEVAEEEEVEEPEAEKAPEHSEEPEAEKAAHESLNARIDGLIEDVKVLVSGLSEDKDSTFAIPDAVRAYANVSVISDRLATQFADFVESVELTDDLAEAACELSDAFANMAEDTADSAVELNQVTEATIGDLDAAAVQHDFREVMEALISGLETYKDLMEEEEGEEHEEHEEHEKEGEEHEEHEEKPEHKDEEEGEESPKDEA